MILSERQRENVNKIRDIGWAIGSDRESVKAEIKVSDEQRKQHAIRVQIENHLDLRRIEREHGLPFDD